MAPSKKKGRTDNKNLVIGILLVIVAVQSFFLFKAYKGDSFVLPKVTKRSVGIPTEKKIPKTVKREPRPAAPAKLQGRIAIIIDDSGYSTEICDYLAETPGPMTVSILPNLEHSIDVASCARRFGKEVMLHLPMEPHHYTEHYPNGYVIKTSMKSDEVIGKLNQALNTIPFVEGVNNHMGSRATEDRRIMSLVFSELKKKRLFYVDSLVTSKSVCREMAGKSGVAFTQRDVFLDNTNERKYIENQFAQLAREAREKGFAVGIGHARNLTLQIIKEQARLLSQQGFQIISVRSLIQNQ